MTISSVGGGYSAYATFAGNRTQGATNAPKVESRSDIDEVHAKGLLAFAKTAKKESWEEQLKKWREEAMKAMGLTEDKLNAMSPEARAKALQQINEAVQQKIKEAMERAKEEGKRTGQMGVPQFVDFMT